MRFSFQFYLDSRSILDPATQSDQSSRIRWGALIHAHLSRARINDMRSRTQSAINRFAPIYSRAISRSNERAFRRNAKLIIAVQLGYDRRICVWDTIFFFFFLRRLHFSLCAKTTLTHIRIHAREIHIACTYVTELLNPTYVILR